MTHHIDVNRKAYVMQEINKQIEVPENAREWQLYTSNIGEGLKAVDLVAHDLTYNLVMLIGSSKSTRESVWKKMNSIMANMSYYGAADTEPMSILTGILDQVFGEENV